MLLDLNPTEANDLREALQTFHRTLLAELARADQRDYREMLRHKLARFERLIGMLEESPASQPHA
jgi:hypothetical protein